MISETLALVRFFKEMATERKAGFEETRGDILMTAQLSRAMAHEIRTSLNIVELALSAHEKRDPALRDHLIRSVELPLLESMAKGFFGEGLSPEAAAKLSTSIPLDAAHDAEMISESENNSNPQATETSVLGSRVVARIESMRILASHTREIPWIRWQVRLERVKWELIRMLESVMASVEEGESLTVGLGA